MKKLYTFVAALLAIAAYAQSGAPATYYNGFNFNQTGTALKNALATKITNTHTKELSYTPQLWEALKITDLDPADATNSYVLLVYGFSTNICDASPADDNDHRRRFKQSNGASENCEWNREHIYPKSLGDPDLGTSGAGSDAHHLRACDVERNGDRNNKKYTDGSGNSGSVGAGWYPGDEWKGDVARILMYMYLRYGAQCLPKNVVTGATVATDSNMPQLLLKWNAEDPVSPHEDKRNTYLGNANNNYGQGNRNPFIDNPNLATRIWGGPIAADRWAVAGTTDMLAAQLSVYPNPSSNHEIHIESDAVLDEVNLINLNGQLIMKIHKPLSTGSNYLVKDIPSGFYLLRVTSGSSTVTKKVIIN